MAQQQEPSSKSGGPRSVGYPATEVKAEPKRRRLTAEYKLRILTEAENCREPGGIGALVRREGLYSSALTQWRKQRDRGVLSSLSGKRGRKATDPLILEVEALKKLNGKLEQRLKQAELIIEVQKKVSQLLGIPMSEPRTEGAE